MKHIRSDNYCLYDSLHVRLIDDRGALPQKADLFTKDYDYFKIKCDCQDPDLTIIISDIDKNKKGYLLENEEYIFDTSYLFGSKNYKIAKFSYAIEISKSGSVMTRVSPNFFANRLIHQLLLDYLVNLGLFYKGYSNLHCSGIEKNQEAILFTGPGGAGKTSFALYCLSKGYKLLGDDRIFVKNNIAHPFPECPGINHNNLKYIRNICQPGVKNMVSINKFVRVISKGYVEMALSKKFFDVFPRDVLGSESYINSIIFLQPSTEFAIDPIDRDEIIKKLYINQMFEDKYIYKLIFNYSSVFPDNLFTEYINSYQKSLDKNLPANVEAYSIRYPKNNYEIVNKWIEENL